MTARNPGVPFDSSWFESVHPNLPAIRRRADQLITRRTVKKQWQAAWLLKAVQCIDLTTLSGDDCYSNVERLCFKAANPVRNDLIDNMGVAGLKVTCGAVCVYAARVPDAVKALKAVHAEHIPVASVATGFPAGQTPLECRLAEIKWAVKNGASEIDIVINRDRALCNDWQAVYDEVKAMREACGPAHMKAIISVGELGNLHNVYAASMVCMQAGSDFIKTSTGKEGVNANLPCGIVMVRAIREYFERTGMKIGFKPAGGIRSAKESLYWLYLMKEELNVEWLQPHLFRIGASTLLTDIERQLFHHVYGRYAAYYDIPIA